MYTLFRYFENGGSCIIWVHIEFKQNMVGTGPIMGKKPQTMNLVKNV